MAFKAFLHAASDPSILRRIQKLSALTHQMNQIYSD